MLNGKTKHNLVAVAVFVLPVVLVKATSVMLAGSGPEPAQAKHSSPEPIVAIHAEGRPSEVTGVQIAAADHIAFLKQQPLGSTPFYYKARDRNQPEVNDDDNDNSNQVPQFTVQAIIASKKGTLAFIDGKLYESGEAIAKSEWRITKIDGRDSSVTIHNKNTGQTVIAAVQGGQ